MPIAAPAQDAIQTLGMDNILNMIESGRSQTEIARDLGCHVSQLSRYIHADPQRSTRARAAMAASAESWIDRGLQYVLDAPSDAAEIQRARVLESHCARRAAIRNPQYRDRVDQIHSGQVELRSITRRIIDTALPMIEQVSDALPPPAHARAVHEQSMSSPATQADSDSDTV